MPGKDGAPVASDLARDDSFKDIPIAFLTGAVECRLEVDGHTVLLKPVRGTDLIAMSQKHALPAM